MLGTLALVSLSVAGLTAFLWINFGVGLAISAGALIALALVGGFLGRQSWVAARQIRARLTAMVQFLSLHHRKLLAEPTLTERETLAMSLADHRDSLAAAMDSLSPLASRVLSRQDLIPETAILIQVLHHLDALLDACRGRGLARTDHELDQILRLLGQDILRAAITTGSAETVETAETEDTSPPPVIDHWGTGL